MTNRKPPGADWESWVDAVIREGRERGEFDDLRGHGKPIEGLDKPHDELWWVRKKLKDEGVSYLPPTLALRKDREDTLAAIDKLRDEARVRQLLLELNERIRHVNRRPGEGPPSTVIPLDVDEVVAGWKQRRTLSPPPMPDERMSEQLSVPGPAAAAASRRRRGKWVGPRRRQRRRNGSS